MRITNRYLANNMVNNLQNNLSRLAGTQEQISTSRRINRPSDDPNMMGQFMAINASISYNEQYDRNLNDGLAYLDMNDTVMGTTGDALNKAIEYTIQAANDTFNADDRKTIAEQIDKMIDQVVDLANSSVGSKYIFAGTDNGSPPFKLERKYDGVHDRILFNGTIDKVVREVAAHTEYKINAPGIGDPLSADPELQKGVFGETIAFAAGTHTVVDFNAGSYQGTGIFRVLIDLRDRLNANDTAGLQTSIGDLKTEFDKLLQHRVATGSRFSHFESLKTQLLDQNIKLEEGLSNIEDADMSKLSIESSQQQLTYQASLAIGANILRTSLLDFLK